MLTMTQPLSDDELLGYLTPEQDRALKIMVADIHTEKKPRRYLAFNVTVTADGYTQTIGVVERDSCAALLRVIDLLFPDFDTNKPKGLSMKAEEV